MVCGLCYRGNPDSAHLTTDERRVIKRRIANRESAQRARDRKQEDAKATAVEVRIVAPPSRAHLH